MDAPTYTAKSDCAGMQHNPRESWPAFDQLDTERPVQREAIELSLVIFEGGNGMQPS